MNKQTTAAVAIILITCLLGFGLTSMLNMSAYERIEKILSSDVQIDSYHADITGKLNMEMESEEDMPALMESLLKMYSNMSVQGSIDAVLNPEDFQMKILESIKMSGMSFDIEGYLKDEQLLVKYPFFGNYILITLTDFETISETTIPENFISDFVELYKDINKDVSRLVLERLNDENVTYGAPYTMETDGYTQTLNVVEVNLTLDELMDIYMDIASELLENEKSHALIESYVNANEDLDTADFEEGMKELEEALIDLKNPESETRREIESELGQEIGAMTFTIKVGLSNLNIPKIIWVTMDTQTKVDEDVDVTMHLTYDIEYRLSRINQIDQIDVPQVEEGDMTRLSDLIQSMGGY